jgi:hypothetical protein
MTTEQLNAIASAPSFLDVKGASVRSNDLDRLNRPELDANREARDENHAAEVFFFQFLCHPEKWIGGGALDKGAYPPSQSWIRDELMVGMMVDTVPLKHALSASDRDIIRREAEAQAALRERTPEDWRARIDSIPAEFRLALAQIVWWDYFSEREHTQAWPQLDEYVDRFWNRAHANDAPASVIKQYLAELGYTPYSVETRLLGAELS